MKNFSDAIKDQRVKNPNTNVYTFLNDDGHIAETCSYAKLHQKAVIIAGLLHEHVKPGDRALLVYSPGMAFIYAFMGCIYAGVVAVPVVPPISADMIDPLKRIKDDASPSIILGDTANVSLFKSNPQAYLNFIAIPLVNTENLDERWADNFTPPPLTSDSIAFLQYTSGSTGHAKGVMISHKNLLANERIMKRYVKPAHKKNMVGWLPHFHDMGLICAILLPCYAGFSCVLMSPRRFLRNPLTWLKAISDYKGTISPAPNFALELCIRRAGNRKIDGLDLSSWNMALIGAEPVRHDTLERFYAKFKSYGLRKETLYPVYGLAEGTVFVAGIKQAPETISIRVDKNALMANRIVKKDRFDEDGTILVGHGKPITEHKYIIVDPKTSCECNEREIGEIWVKGDSVASGYWNKPDLTRNVFHARLANGDGPYLRTGDLGCTDEKELYITGRLKDLIIINGRNFYPQDIEEAIGNSHPKIRPARVAAFSVSGDIGETLCIVAEYWGKKENVNDVFKRISNCVSRNFGIKVGNIALVPPKTLLFTSSGKLRRKETKRTYMGGRLTVLGHFCLPENTSAYAMEDQDRDESALFKALVNLIAEKIGIPPSEIDIEAPLGEYGLSSIDAEEISAELEILTKRPFSPTMIFENPTIKSLTAFIQNNSDNTRFNTSGQRMRRYENNPIAIIGIGCNFPGAPDVDAFWQLLEKGGNAVSTIAASRPSLKINGPENRNGYDWGAFIDGIKWFDAAFFNISTAEANVMDPQHRKYIEIVWSAIENAGYAPSRLSESDTGVFTGVSAHDYSQLISTNPVELNSYAATGASPAMLSNRISYLLNIYGPSETIDTACSSSLVAVHRAVQAIRNGECEQAIAGGVNAILSYHPFIALNKSGFLSNDGICRTFDAAANGYVRGEGAGAVFLKPLLKAQKDKDHIYAVIRGSAIRHGGRTASLTAPSENRQAVLLKTAFENAGIEPDTITYIEAHGTGTVLGDPIEINGLKKAFSTRNGAKAKTAYCGLGSVKTNIGHLEAAAGIAGLIKTALAIKHNTLPATLHCKKQNPHIDIEDSPFYIVREKKQWGCLEGGNGNGIPRRAGVSSFGFGGTYAHVVLEEAQESVAEKNTDVLSPFLVPISAKTAEALTGNIKALHRFLESTTSIPHTQNGLLIDIAYTLQTGRDHFPIRTAFIADSQQALKNLLESAVSKMVSHAGALHISDSLLKRDSTKQIVAFSKTWLGGADAADWHAINCDKRGKKIPLPGYQFAKNSHWIDIETSNATECPTPSTTPTSHAPNTRKEAIEWLLNEVSVYLDIPVADIDLQTTFDELGLDSIALINIHDRIKTYFDRDLPVSVIQEYPDLVSLAGFIIDEEHYQKPDLLKEADDEIAQLFDSKMTTDTFVSNIDYQGPPNHILLTGATGFFGIFLLKELLQTTQADVYCLVRAATPQDGLKRIQESFTAYSIDKTLIDQRVRILCGDLIKDHFGLAPKTYDELAQRIDTVFHCGAVVDWMKPYLSLKKANVGGTAETIKFSYRKKMKRLHYISSLAVLPPIEGKPTWLESEQPPPRELTNGYAQSKWVAERLCAEARDRGLMVNIYRFDYVVGSAATGAMKATDFIVRLIKGCIQTGYIPTEEVNFDILSVDHLSKAVVGISKLNQAKTYHLMNRQPFCTSDFTKLLRECGYKLDIVPYSVWQKIVKASPECALYPLYPFLAQYDLNQLSQYFTTRIDNTNTLKALFEVDQNLITDVLSALDILKKVITHFQQIGELPAPKYRDVLQRQAFYWQKQLEDAPRCLNLPLEARKRTENEHIITHPFAIEPDILRKIERLSTHENISVAEIFLAVFQILLFRYCRIADVPVAVPTAIPAGKNGLFAVKIPIIRTAIEPHTSFRSFIVYVSQLVTEAHAHLELPSDTLARSLYSQSGNNAGIVYDTLFVFREDDQKAAIKNRLNLFPIPSSDVSQEFSGIKLVFEKSGKKCKGSIRYSSHRFTDETIAGVQHHFVTLLKNITDNVDWDVCRVPIMTAAETKRIVYQWNQTQKADPTQTCIHDIFAAHARRQPQAIALKMDGSVMTYQELNQRADTLASVLVRQNLQPGELIGICMGKCFELITGILGILKAGCAYVPIDPAYPRERIEYMMTDADTKIVLTHSAAKMALPESGADMICLDTEWEQITYGFPAQGIAAEAAISNIIPADEKIAYMIYTSGSTGNPKGVKVFHSGLTNLMSALDESLQINASDCAIACAAISFDASVLEMFYPLFKGASLALVPSEIVSDGFRLKAFLEENSITFMAAAVPIWRMLEYAKWKGKPTMKIVSGGEALPFDLAQTLLRWGRAAFNSYGPAETTVGATLKKLEPNRRVTIGKPMANIKTYILDEFENPMPICAAGELCIGGAGVAQGYHHRPTLTNAKFRPNPFADNPAERIYKTGDLARYLPNGDIDFIGRIDDQVKLRGHRIELGEIETAVERLDQVNACKVLACNLGNEKKLVAYIIPAEENHPIPISEIKNALKGMLPDIMIPSDYMLLNTFPVTPGGKIDREAFPPPGTAMLTDDYKAPATALEIQLCDIWKTVLKRDIVGIHNSFLDLGGNSLSAMKLLIRVNEVFGSDLTIQDLYENPTIARLSKAILGGHAHDTSSNAPSPIDFAMETRVDLEVNIRQTSNAATGPDDMKRLLLTGVTGFLGAYMLHYLLEKTAADVFCLVRAEHATIGSERIRQNLEKHRLWQASYDKRIKPVVGDLSQPQLGLPDTLFDFLAEKIDAIHHCGSIVNFAYPYQFLKKPNVEGTKEILKLAVSQKMKPLYYVSTIGVFEQDRFSNGQCIRERDTLPSPDGLFFGYSKSKWVAEKILSTFQKKGVPISIFRPPSILGDSRSGICNLDDLLNIMITVITKVGAIPDMDFNMNGLPVDFVAQTIVDISLHPNGQKDIFHIVNPTTVSVKQLIDYFSSFGYNLPVLPYESWHQLLVQTAKNDDDLLPFVSVIDKEITTMNGNRMPTYLFDNVQNVLPNYASTAPVLSEKLFHSYLAYLEEIGYIQKCN